MMRLIAAVHESGSGRSKIELRSVGSAVLNGDAADRIQPQNEG
jgi:hypothetical protein